jgi:hypothetical protein
MTDQHLRALFQNRAYRWNSGSTRLSLFQSTGSRGEANR